jgi:hypothetical protein
MQKIMGQNWFIWLASLIPGLGIALLGKRKLGLGVGLVICVLFAIFWFVPHIVTWFIFGIAFIAQMTYAVAVVTIRATKSEISLKSHLLNPLPASFSQKHIEDQALNALAPLLSGDQELTTAIAGLQKDTSQHRLVGLTQDHLILAACSPDGSPTEAHFILRADVTGINLLIGGQNMLLTIKYGDEKVVTLYVLKKLRQPAILIVEELSGKWMDDVNLGEAFTYIKELFRPGTIIVFLICLVLALAMTEPPAGLTEADQKAWGNICFSLGLYIASWPYIIIFIRWVKKDRGLSSVNAFIAFFIVGIILLWVQTLLVLGNTILHYL